MIFRRTIGWRRVAIGLGLAITMLSTAAAQGRGGVPEPYTPAAARRT